MYVALAESRRDVRNKLIYLEAGSPDEHLPSLYK
jgi:hypothetical protein